MSESNNSNRNSPLSDNQNLDQTNDLNSKISNLAEPSFSSYDRDDSLYDALSFDAQTPFKIDNNNHDQGYSKLEQNNLNSYRESLKDQETNRYSLIDLEFIKSSKNSKEDQTDLMLDLKDTSIDEILLIADDTHTARISDTSRLRNASPSKIPVLAKNLKNSPKKSNLNRFKSIENYKDFDYFQGMRSIEKTPSPNDQYKIQNDTLEFNQSTELKDFNPEPNKSKNNNVKSNLERLKERINSINFNDNRKKNDGFEIMKTPQPILVEDEFMNPNDGTTGSKNEGAFKLYTTNFDENNESIAKIFNKDSEKNRNQNNSNPVSPFFSIDKQSNLKGDIKHKRGPVKKYRSGSTSNLNITNNNERPRNNSKASNNKQNSERIRPATHNEITYSVDSDESTIIDNLINDPERLKKKLKQSRIEREQLNQLQQNYTRLLQQYAEAENFIDAFRLNGQILANSSNPTPVVKGSLLTNDSKSQTNAGFQPNYTQPSICSSTATLSSNQLNNDKTNSLNGSKTVLITDHSNPFTGKQTISLIKAQSNDNLHQNKELVFKSQSTNNFQPVDNLNRIKSQSTVYVIPSKNRSNSEFEPKSPSINETNCETKIPIAEEENIIIDQTSTLGILVQIKVLEEKMQSFITLVNESQLNKFEQRQVFDSIKNDYQVLIKNYNEIKSNNSDNLVQEQIEMDVDLNKELGKMKTLLDNIVHKMNDNLIDELSECTDDSDKQSLEYSSIATFYDNQVEIMDQRNRLLDVFKDEKPNSSNNSNNKNSNINQQTKKEQNEQVILSNLKQKLKDQQENIKTNKQEDKKRNIQNNLNASTNETASKLTNSNKTSSNRNTKIAENTTNLINSKKLSRISVDRMDQFENEDSINIIKKQKKQQLNRNTNINRRLTKMSNESSTSTLSTSDNESTQIYEKDLKPSFKNYIDEIDETVLDKTPVRQEKKTKQVEEKTVRNKKPEIKQISDIESSDQENDVTIRKLDMIQKSKKNLPQTKSVSIVNLYEPSRIEKRHKELKQESKQNFKNSKKNVDMKNLPVAKAYEGSDSLEDIDSSISITEQQQEYASSTLVKNEHLKRNRHIEKRPELYSNKVKPSNRNSQNDIDYEKVRKHDTIGLKHFREEMTPKNKRLIHQEVEIQDDSSIFTSDVDSIIERKRALKNSKKDLMKKLAEEVEFLKQEILKKNRTNSKPRESERSKKRIEYINSDSAQSVPDNELTLATNDKKEETKTLENKYKKSPKILDPKLAVQNNVLIQNNQKILVVQNEFGEKKYFCLMGKGEKSPKEKRNGKILSSDSTSTLCSNSSNEIRRQKQQLRPKDNRLEKSKYYSVSNLTEIKKKNNKRLDDYFSEEELDHQVFYEPKIKPNNQNKYATREKRYQSSNDIFDNKCYNTRSLNDFARNSSKHRSQNIILRELDDRKSEYSFPVVMENGKRPIPIVIGKPIKKNSKSRECLIFLPVQNQDLIKNMPINLIQYPFKEPIINDNLDDNFENSIKNLTNAKPYKYASSHQINEDIYTPTGNIDESAQEKKSRRVRYYIREYTDISTISDNEMMYRRYDQDEMNLYDKNESDSVDIDILVDQAITYAHCITNNARRIRNKLSTS